MFLNFEHIENISIAKKIFQFCLHAICLLALVLKQVGLCNLHLGLKILYNLYSHLSKKLLAQSKHNNIKITLFSAMFSHCCASLNRQNYDK